MARLALCFLIASLTAELPEAAGQERQVDWQTISLPAEARARSIIGTDDGLFVGSDTGTLIQFTTRALDDPKTLASMSSSIERIASTPDGLTLGVLGKDGTMSLIIPATAQQTRFEGATAEAIIDLAIASNDRVVGIGKNGTRYIWSASGLSSLPLNVKEPLALAPNGGYVAAWRDQEGLVVLDATSGAVAFSQTDWLEMPATISISSTGRLLAAADGSSQALIRVWDLRAGELIRTLSVPGKKKIRLLFDRREQQLVCIDKDGDVFRADIESGSTTKIATTVLPGVSPESILGNTALYSTNLCSIDNQGAIVAPAPKEIPVFAAAPSADFVKVPVFVATNRARSTPPTFMGGFRRFFAHAFGLLCLILAFVIVAVLATVKGRRSAGVALLLSALLLSTLAAGQAIDAAQEYRPETRDMFGASLGEMTYGVCTVTVPSTGRRKGQLSSPLKVWVFEQTADPDYHVILQHTDVLDEELLLKRIKERVTASPANDAFIFIHGYNVTFEDAVRRTAQLAYDLSFAGAPICFSWPSFGIELAYPWDARNADASVPQLQQFLRSVAAKSGAARVHIIAHSMGNRVLSQAIETDPEIVHAANSVFHHLVLAAPDVDKDLFVKRIAPRLVGSNQKVTLYGSSHDRALALSKAFNGQARAGDTRPQVTCFRGIDSIDCSQADSSRLGHSYISDEPMVLSDLFYLLSDKPAGERFGLEQLTVGTDTFWRIRP
jgi:esterase/lipase superfamily enzyme